MVYYVTLPEYILCKHSVNHVIVLSIYLILLYLQISELIFPFLVIY